MGNNITKERMLLLKKEYSKLPEGSLNIKCHNGYYNFYHYINSKQLTINRDVILIYKLARKKYLRYLICNKSENEIRALLETYIRAGLDLRRITLTPQQYRWVTSKYPKNTGWKENLKFMTDSGIAMRSKSERDIGNELEFYAAPYRYDMLFKIDVSVIVNGLRDYLATLNHWRYSPRALFTYRDGYCVWNVPEELQWMNAPGSIWRSYDSSTHEITISVDFAIMLGDGSVLLWEHAGLCLNPVYRCNTSERIFVIRATGYVPEDSLLFTTENDVLNLAAIDKIITEKILPRL